MCLSERRKTETTFSSFASSKASLEVHKTVADRDLELREGGRGVFALLALPPFVLL